MKSLPFTSKDGTRCIGVLVVHVPKNQLIHYRVIQKEMLAAIEEVRPGAVIHVRTHAV